MAKQRRTNSITSAISSVTKAIRAEFDSNLTAEEKSVVINGAMDIVDDSGVMTMAEHGDDTIETAHQVDAVFEQAGIDPVQFRRDRALAGANMTVEIVALEERAEQDEIEQEVGEPPE